MKNNIVMEIVRLQKSGVVIHLTEAGWVEFLKLVQENGDEDVRGEAV